MKHNRLLSLLLALILLAGAAVPARCAGQPTVICETGVKDGVVSLSLEDLDGSAVYGVQVELVLEGEYPRSVFTPSSRAAYSPGCVVETRRDTTSVTVYLTGSAALNRDGTVDLGELDLGVNELVSWDALPESASVILLNQQLRPMTGSMSGSFPVTATAPAGTSFAPSPSQPESPKPSSLGQRLFRRSCPSPTWRRGAGTAAPWSTSTPTPSCPVRRLPPSPPIRPPPVE